MSCRRSPPRSRSLSTLATPAGFEPATCRLEDASFRNHINCPAVKRRNSRPLQSDTYKSPVKGERAYSGSSKRSSSTLCSDACRSFSSPRRCFTRATGPGLSQDAPLCFVKPASWSSVSRAALRPPRTGPGPSASASRPRRPHRSAFRPTSPSEPNGSPANYAEQWLLERLQRVDSVEKLGSCRRSRLARRWSDFLGRVRDRPHIFPEGLLKFTADLNVLLRLPLYAAGRKSPF